MINKQYSIDDSLIKIHWETKDIVRYAYAKYKIDVEEIREQRKKEKGTIGNDYPSDTIIRYLEKNIIGSYYGIHNSSNFSATTIPRTIGRALGESITVQYINKKYCNNTINECKESYNAAIKELQDYWWGEPEKINDIDNYIFYPNKYFMQKPTKKYLDELAQQREMIIQNTDFDNCNDDNGDYVSYYSDKMFKVAPNIRKPPPKNRNSNIFDKQSFEKDKIYLSYLQERTRPGNNMFHRGDFIACLIRNQISKQIKNYEQYYYYSEIEYVVET